MALLAIQWMRHNVGFVFIVYMGISADETHAWDSNNKYWEFLLKNWKINYM